MIVVDNKAREFYDMMMDGYKHGDLSKGVDAAANNKFVHGVISLSEAHADNPFEDPEARQLYFKMTRCYDRWRSPSVDRKVNRRRMLECAIALCEKGIDNPFVENPYEDQLEPLVKVGEDTVSLDEIVKKEFEASEQADIESGTYVPVTEKVRMFGVVDKKKGKVIR